VKIDKAQLVKPVMVTLLVKILKAQLVKLVKAQLVKLVNSEEQIRISDKGILNIIEPADVIDISEASLFSCIHARK